VVLLPSPPRYFSEASIAKLTTTRDTDPAVTAELEPGT